MKRLIGAFGLANIEIDTNGEGFVPSKTFSNISKRAWANIERKLAKRGGKIWNGKIYRLSNISRNNGKKVLYLSTIDFKTHYATEHIAKNVLESTPFSKRPNGMYVGAFLKTSDNYFIFAKSSNKGTVKTAINFIGGNLNKDELEIRSAKDLFRFFKKELQEETALKARVIKSLKGVGIFISLNFRIAIIFSCLLDQAKKSIEKMIKPNFESEGFIFIKEGELKERLKIDKSFNSNIKGSYKYLASVK